MNLQHCAAAVLLAFAPAVQPWALEIELSGPGSLAPQNVKLESTLDSYVAIKGQADVRDLSLLQGISDHVRTLDLSALTIEAYNYSPGGYKGRITFPEGELVPDMLAGTNVTKVLLPLSSRVNRIGDNAFAHTKLESIEIPANITYVGNNAFADSKELASVTVKGSPGYGSGVFMDCSSLRLLDIASPITSIPDDMFRNCTSLASMPEGISSIGAQAFRGTALTTVDLSGVSSVGDYAFAEIPALREVSWDGSVLFGAGVFFGDIGLQDLTGWTADVPDAAAAHAGLKTPLSINSAIIGGASFADNPEITYVTLGSGVQEIKAHAFRNDTGITDINVVALGANIPVTDRLAFSGLEDENGKYPIRLSVLDTSVDAWSAAPVWQDFRIVGVSGVTSLDDRNISVTATRSGNVVTAVCTVPITSMSVYGLDGMVYFNGGENECEIQAEVPADVVVVVKIVAANRVKVLKLR